MNLMIILLCLAVAISLSVAALSVVVTKSRPLISFVAVFAALCVSFALGGLWQKALFVNRHLDMCSDQTSKYFVEHGRFDPYCKVFAR